MSLIFVGKHKQALSAADAVPKDVLPSDSPSTNLAIPSKAIDCSDGQAQQIIQNASEISDSASKTALPETPITVSILSEELPATKGKVARQRRKRVAPGTPPTPTD